MCVIIIKENKKTKISQDILTASAVINPHGLGVVWLDTYKLEYFESSEYDILNTNRPFIAHFRYATIGGNTPKNRHPFRVKDDEYLFQNGTNYNLGYKDKTDTEHLAEVLVKCDRKVWKNILELTESRYCTVDLKNKTFEVYNKQMWYERDGVLYSKNNVIDKAIVAVYGTLKEGHSNYYNYLVEQNLLGSGETVNKYPMIINGLPYVLSQSGKGHHIDVDVFLVDKHCMEELDLLEGHPTWYKRELTPILLEDGGVVDAWLYFNDTVEDTGEYHKSFEQSYTKYSKRRHRDDFGGMCQNCGSIYVEYGEYICDDCLSMIDDYGY